jgi:F-type H+-transporting ATPase subunit delta
MLGASKIAYQSLIKLVDSNKNLHSFENGESVLLLADAISGNKTLLTTLTDTGISPEARAGVAKDVLAKSGTTEAVSLISEAVKMRWSEIQDLVQSLEASGARALFAASELKGELDRVEDEVFAFERAIAASGELELMLANPNMSAKDRASVINDLVGKTFSPTAVLLINHAISHRHGRSITSTLGDLQELAAARRGRVLAEVTAAIALTDDQEQRLTNALTAIYKQDVQVQVVINKKVIGGVAVRVGDEVIDGTVANRLAQVKRQLAG